MKGRIRWLVGGVIVAALLLIGFAGTALADPKGTPGGPRQDWSGDMEEMHEWCWGPNGPMGGGARLGLGYLQLETLAGLLDTSVDNLVAQRKEGKSFVDIAKAKGVELQTLIDTLTAELKENLQLRVKNGVITQAQADSILKTRQETLKSILESTANATTDGGYGRYGMMGGGMMGGFGGMMGRGFGFRTS